MKKKLVSIIVPVYNVEKYIEECLDSIVSQTYKYLEIILIDDGSRDGSGKIADTYACKDVRIKVIHQNNSGVSSARNTGIDTATGDYVCFVDSDDYIRKDFIENLVADMTKYHVDIVTTTTNKTKLYPIDDSGVDEIEVLDAIEALVLMYYGKLEKSENGVQMFKAELLKENNITYDNGKIVCEDFDFFAQALLVSSKIAVDYRKMYYYRPNPNSVMNQKINLNFFKAIDNKSKVGLAVSDKHPALRNAIKINIFNSSVSLAMRGYQEREKWQKEFTQIWYNLREYRWLALLNKNTKPRVRMAALLYCVFGNRISTIILRSIKK